MVIMAVKALKRLCYCCCCCEQTVSLGEPSYSFINRSEILLACSSQSLTDSEPSRSHSMTSYDHSQRERSRTGSFREVDRARDIKPSPPLECFIIPSFGEDPPDNVAVKLKITDKMASDFLEGVGEDFDIIQKLIMEDDNKQLREVRLMCHFAQKTVKEFKKAIEDAMKNLKLKHTQKGCKYNHRFIDYVTRIGNHSC